MSCENNFQVAICRFDQYLSIMPALGIQMLFMWSLLPLVIVLFVYSGISWRWKLKPHRILTCGLLLMALSFGMHTYLDVQLQNQRKQLAQSGQLLPEKAIKTIESFLFSSEKLQKLIEFLSIPLSVSLIGAALLAKSDIELQNEISRYNQRRDRLSQQELDLHNADNELREMIYRDVRGKELLDKADQVKYLKEGCSELHWDLIDDFGHLIKASIVPRPKRGKKDNNTST